MVVLGSGSLDLGSAACQTLPYGTNGTAIYFFSFSCFFLGLTDVPAQRVVQDFVLLRLFGSLGHVPHHRKMDYAFAFQVIHFSP